MPFPFESSKEPVRTRRSKDKDSRSTTSSSSNKKSKHTSGSSSRSTPQLDRGAQASLYAQQNLTLDQLPALPESGTASPGSASSPILRAASVTSQPQNHPTPSFQHQTPAALRQYLETDDVETPRSETAPQPHLVAQESLRRSGDLQEIQARYNKPLDSHTVTPLATSTQGYQAPSRDRSVSPGFFGQPLELHRSHSSRTSSSRRNQTSSYSASSPPPQSASPSVRSYAGPGSPDPSQYQSQIHLQPAYVASPTAFAPAIPYHCSVPNESYYPSPYAASQYLPMTNAGGHVDVQSLPQQTNPPYTNYLPPHPSQGYFNHLQYPSVGGSSDLSSRMSVPGEFPMAPPAQGTPTSDSPGMAKSVNEDDAADLLQRIQGALPDISALLQRYTETSGQLGERESRLLEIEAQKSEAVRQKEATLDSQGKDLAKLRFEVQNKEEKQKELEDILAAEKTSKDDLQASHQAELAQKQREWEDKLASMERNFATQKTQMLEDFEGKEKALQERIDHQSQDTKATLQAQLDDVKKTHAQEKESLSAAFDRQMREAEARHSGEIQGWKRKLQLKADALEDSRRARQGDAAKWAEERAALTGDWDRERAVLSQGSDEQNKSLTDKHQSEIDRLHTLHSESTSRIRQQAEDEKAKLRKEIQSLKAGWDADKTHFAYQSKELKTTATELNEKNAKLQKLAATFGEVTDLKPREDVFYLDAFGTLEKQISDLAAAHFQELPDFIPRQYTDLIPSSMPSFFHRTEPAKRLCAAYVKHHISDIITRFIFQPFLFVLDGRLAPADKLFQEMSEELKRKSTKREALWRQRTLHAAYTASSAKQSINKVATHIVEEILKAIKYFTHPTQWPHLTVAVRRVVKTAAEAWRYARLEMGLITASMSVEDIIQAPDAGPGVSTKKDDHTQERCRNILLPLFPFIKRDPMIGDLVGKPDLNDEGYVYSPGQVLYSDDADVIAGYSSRSRRSRKPPSVNPTLPETQPHGIEESSSAQSAISRPQSRMQKDSFEEQTSQGSPTSLTQSRTQNRQSEEETPREWSTSHADSRTEDHRTEEEARLQSPTSRQDTPSPVQRATLSPIESHHHDRATPSPAAQVPGQWHEAERGSRSPTPAQDHHVDMATPGDGAAASDRSATSSRLSVRSKTTEASGRSRHSMSEPAPRWNNASGEIPALQHAGDEW